MLMIRVRGVLQSITISATICIHARWGSEGLWWKTVNVLSSGKEVDTAYEQTVLDLLLYWTLPTWTVNPLFNAPTHRPLTRENRPSQCYLQELSGKYDLAQKTKPIWKECTIFVVLKLVNSKWDRIQKRKIFSKNKPVGTFSVVFIRMLEHRK